MSDRSYTTTFSVDRTPDEVFRAINDPGSWWNAGIDRRVDRVGDEFEHRVEGVHHARLRVTELLPGERVVWRVLENWMSFIADPTEWVDTELRFDLSAQDGGTEVRFTHAGLVPEFECYDVCATAWGFYAGESLKRSVTTGVGLPSANPAEERYKLEVQTS